MRLTKEDRYGHFYTNEANCRNIWSLDGKKLEGEFFENQTLAIDGLAIDKLGQLEDIEEAMGVDLILYLKMCVIEASVFIFSKVANEVYEIRCPKCVYNPYLKAFGFKALKDTYNWRFPMSEYGKTWALSKEELNK